eukprot:4013868-Amphidinium_carterae.1
MGCVNAGSIARKQGYMAGLKNVQQNAYHEYLDRMVCAAPSKMNNKLPSRWARAPKTDTNPTTVLLSWVIWFRFRHCGGEVFKERMPNL